MQRFVILDPFGGLLDETDDLDAVLAFARAGNFVTCYVEPDALSALLGFVRESVGTVEIRLRRRRWKVERLAIDPTCGFCGKDLTLPTASVDHLVSLAEGGRDDESNWELSCQRCNAEKGSLSVEAFFERVVNARAFRELRASMPAA
jgi:hypothetical protein